MPVAFEKLPDDILFNILLTLTVWDLAHIRQTSRLLYAVTRRRTLWTQVIRQHILHEGLPWPPYAWPLTCVPTPTLEALALRAILTSKYWDSGKISPLRHPVRRLGVNKRSERLSWLHVLRGRWLVIGRRDKSLELWDLENVSPTYLDCFLGMSGPAISGGSYYQKDKMTLVVGTGSNDTYIFEMNISHFGDTATLHEAARNFQLVDQWPGYFGVLEVRGDLIGFATSSEAQGAAFYSTSRRTYIALHGGRNIEIHQSALAIQIRDDMSFVARNWNLDVYMTSSIVDLLDKVMEGHRWVTPIRSIRYPLGEYEFLSQAAFVTPSVSLEDIPPLSSPNDLIINGTATDRTFRQWKLGTTAFESEEPWGWVSNHFKAAPILYMQQFQPGADYKWGSSGNRVSYAVCPPAAPFRICNMRISDSGWPSEDVTMSRTSFLELPKTVDGDFPWVHAYDEGTGIVVCGMASGVLWACDTALPKRPKEQDRRPRVREGVGRIGLGLKGALSSVLRKRGPSTLE